MKMASPGRFALLAAISLGLVAGCGQQTSGPASMSGQPAAGGNDIAGRVTSTNGAEAGVWVIAETDDLDTRFARIVVT
ncbi:MAG: hypothetical protein OEQ25_15895, partial [Gammaproteobacteria bacterium]|nr:hypothetical protein [Gammaproteobacteria bacterium]